MNDASAFDDLSLVSAIRTSKQVGPLTVAVDEEDTGACGSGTLPSDEYAKNESLEPGQRVTFTMASNLGQTLRRPRS